MILIACNLFLSINTGSQTMAHVYTMYPICAITVVLVASVQFGMAAAVVNTTSPPSPILLSKSLHLIVVGAAECNSIYYIYIYTNLKYGHLSTCCSPWYNWITAGSFKSFN